MITFAKTTQWSSGTRVTKHSNLVYRAAIDKLRGQNARLKEELLLENKFSVRPSNPGATVLINKLQDEADLYTRKVKFSRSIVLTTTIAGFSTPYLHLS